MEDECHSWSARPSQRVIEMLHGHEDGSARWIAVIGEGAAAVHVGLGDPVAGWTQKMYVPQWVIAAAGLEGVGEELRIRFERCESFLKAEKLGFQVMGDIPAGIELQDLLEEPLSQLGVIQKGQIIPVPLFEGVNLVLTTCEPDAAVFLDGAEVSLEIEGDEARTPEPQPQPQPEPQVDLPMFPIAQPVIQSGFVPFSGLGRRLCD